MRRPVLQTDPYWEGVFDAIYTKPGDILRRREDGAIFFVAAQQPMLPVLCVRALRLVSMFRPASATGVGLNLYGGVVASTDTPLAQGWPASLLPAAGAGTGLANLQSELAPPSWDVLLPTSLRLMLLVGDRLTDDQGRVGVIATAETTDLGTRLNVRQAST